MIKILNTSILFIVSTALVLLLPTSVNAQLAITEIMPDTISPQDASEWLEIFNYSSFDIPLSDIKVNGKSLSSEQTALAAENYLIITKSKQSFVTEFGSQLNLSEAPITLSNSGSNVEITLTGNVIDTKTYPSSQVSRSWQRSGFNCSNFIWAIPTINAPNANYTAPCNQLAVSDSGKSLSYELATGLIISDSNQKLFGFFDENNFIYGNNLSNYSGDVLITGYYFQNNFLYYTSLLSLNLTGGSSSSTTTSAASSISSSVSSASSSSTASSNTSSAISSSASSAASASSSTISSQSSTSSANSASSSTTSSEISSSGSSAPVSSNSSSSSSASSQISTNTSSVGSQSSNSSNTTSTSSQSNTSSQAVIPSLEISEVYAAPTTGEKEWLEIFNFGPEADISVCEIKDNVGKHKLVGVLTTNSFLQITDLKVSLNNSGELLQLYCAGQLIDSWQQPAVKSTEATMRKFGSLRHSPEIFVSLQATAGKENELILPISSVSSASLSSTSNSSSSSSKSVSSSKSISSIKSVSSSKSLTSSLSSTKAVSVNSPDVLGLETTSRPTFTISNTIPQESETYTQEAQMIGLILIVAAAAQTVLVFKVLWRNPTAQKLIARLKKYLQYQINQKLGVVSVNESKPTGLGY